MKVKDIKRGDIIKYRSGRINIVNKPEKYHYYFNEEFENSTFGKRFDIMEIKRYVKFLWFYRLKVIYKR